MQLMPSLSVKQKQSLVMTPQLQQAIKLLQMTNIDIRSFLEEQALESFIGHESVVKQGGATLSTHTMQGRSMRTTTSSGRP
mgnify:CR=1 FL=1